LDLLDYKVADEIEILLIVKLIRLERGVTLFDVNKIIQMLREYLKEKLLMGIEQDPTIG